MNVMHTPGAERAPKRRRRNSSTSGSSSLVSYDTPKTPRDAYSQVEHSPFEQGVPSTQKKRQDAASMVLRDVPWLKDPSYAREASTSEVPAWLSSTVATLQVNHPLRNLIPAGGSHIAHIPGPDEASSPQRPQRQVAREPEVVEEIEIFAFRPPTRQEEQENVESHGRSLDVSVTMRHSAPLSSFVEAPFLGPHPRFPDAVTNLPSRLDSYPYDVSPSPDPALEVPEYMSIALSKVSPVSISRQPSRAPPDHSIAPYMPRDNSSMPAPFSEPGPLAPPRLPPSAAAGPLDTDNTTSFAHDKSALDSALARPAPLPFSTPGPLVAPHLTLTSGMLARSRRTDSPLPEEDIWDHLDAAQDPTLVELSAAEYSGDASDSGLPPSDPSWSSPASDPRLLRGDLRNWSLPAAPVGRPFSTPVHPTRVYFDSPIEDPISSDPLDPADYELDLDYENLDFRWEKFDRGDSATARNDLRPSLPASTAHDTLNGQAHSAGPMIHTALPLPRIHTVQRPPGMTEDLNMSSPVSSGTGKSISLPVASDTPHVGENEHPKEAQALLEDNAPHASPATAPARPAFNPAPGIYISPLKGNTGSGQDLDEQRARENSLKNEANAELAPENLHEVTNDHLYR